MLLISNPYPTVLHDQLVAAAHAQATRPHQPSSHAHLQPNRDQHSNIDPAIAGGPLLAASNPNPPAGAIPDQVDGGQHDMSDPDMSQESRKTYGKRELSTSKRAAQNRAAQVKLSSIQFRMSVSLFLFF
jgi:hypothetical protein